MYFILQTLVMDFNFASLVLRLTSVMNCVSFLQVNINKFVVCQWQSCHNNFETLRHDWFQNYGVLPRKTTCIHCGRPLSEMKQSGSYFYFYCGQCKSSKSIKHGTFLNQSQLSFRSTILLVYFLCAIPTLTYDQSMNVENYQITTSILILFLQSEQKSVFRCWTVRASRPTPTWPMTRLGTICFS